MAAMTFDPSLSLQISKEHNHSHKNSTGVIEEIEGLIKVYKDGHVERPQIVPNVTCAVAPDLGVTSMDIIIDKCTNIWARFYLPKFHGNRYPLLVYFHGGGFCVGSASWSCYHEFLAKLASKASCAIISVNYRLAPENPLPAAYDDGFKALFWIKQQCHNPAGEWLTSKCDLTSIFLAGDSAGANIAYNIATRLGSPGGSASEASAVGFKGTIFIQPFFGGESRTHSEKYMEQPPRSALSLPASDTYWRLSLPAGSNRDHPWCNPLAKGAPNLQDLKQQLVLPTMICVSELDILKDRNLELCAALTSAGKKVETVLFRGVGHAFQILNKSQISQTRTDELICRIQAFISGR